MTPPPPDPSAEPPPAAPSRTRIKICGVKDAPTARVVAESGADLIGFVFIERSPRFLPYAAARAIAADLPDTVTPVALVNHLSEPRQFDELHRESGIRWVQLHGDEPPELAGRVPDCPLLRSLPAPKADDADLVAAWATHQNVEAFLWDAPASPGNPLGGGSGQTSDWAWLRGRLPAAPPSILAGGLTPDNVGRAIRTVRPWGVDVSSGVESSRGVKDHGLIRAFCAAVREADASLALD
ncbi:MAG: phosphoribosylanthranilate isomerase [Planctomycetota bacterium]